MVKEAISAIGPYRIVRKLDTGGMGEVYLAYDARLDRQVAIKRMLPRGIDSAELCDRFRREARLAAKLNHPAIVQIYDIVQDSEGDCLVMEYVDGTTLRRRLAGKNLGLAQVLDLARQITAGMAAAHDAGIIHRDLKSENILLTRTGTAKIVDFGVAKAADDDSLTVEGAIVGTFRSMSPEQASGKPVDHRSDLFSFGVLLYEAITHKSPFKGNNLVVTLHRLINEPHVPAASLIPGLPPLLDKLIDQLLAKDPLLRPCDFHEVASLLDEINRDIAAIGSMNTLATLAIDPQKSGRGAEGADHSKSETTPHFEVKAPAMAAAQLAPTLPAGLRDKTPEPPRGTLWGRDDVLQDLIAEATRCLADWTQVLSTIDGGIGLGKSHVLSAFADALRDDLGPPVIHLGTPPRTSHPHSLARLLFHTVFSLSGRRTSGQDSLASDMLDKAWATLGARPTPAGRAATAVVLGAAESDSSELASDLRQSAAQALALALTHAALARPLFLLIDDIHLGDEIALDALEMASGDKRAVPLGIWTAAQPTLYSLRPWWGRLASCGQRHTLRPLARPDARALLSDRIDNAESVSQPLWDQLYEFSGGIPIYLVELARTLSENDALADGSDALADGSGQDQSQKLFRKSDAGFDERLGRQVLRAIPESRLVLAEVCAVLEDDFSAHDVRAVLASLNEESAVASEDTVSAGLAELCQLGIVKYELHAYAIHHPILAAALSSLIPAERKRGIHAAIVDHLRASDASSPGRVAHHAARCGASDLAAEIHIDLAWGCQMNYRLAEADEHYTLALSYLADKPAERMRALAGRGRVRHRLQCFSDALGDLRGARAIAESCQDKGEQVALLLDEAELLDDCAQWGQSFQAVELALAGIGCLDSDEKLAALHLACGRTHYRREQFADAVELLESSVERAATVGDYEIHITALLFLAPALVHQDRVAEAETRYDEAIALCRRTGDERQLAASHVSRRALWLSRGNIQGMVADLEATRKLANKLGCVQIERAATLHLAESLYWYGRYDEALALAEESRTLYQDYLSDYPMYDDHLLVARILCSQRNPGASLHLERAEASCSEIELPPTDRALLTLVRLATAALQRRDIDYDAWVKLERSLGHSAYQRQLRVEVAMLAAEVLCHRARFAEARVWRDRAAETAAGSRLWETRLAVLQKQL